MNNVVEIPDSVDYPEFFKVSEQMSLFKDMLVYILEPYDLVSGIGLYVGFREDCTLVRAFDFKSNNLDFENPSKELVEVMAWIDYFKQMMATMKVMDSCFYFANSKNGLVLVDMMVSANKFAGPGMLRDLFGNKVPMQKVVEICPLNEDNISKYKGKLVKPSRFRTVLDGKHPRPQYGILD